MDNQRAGFDREELDHAGARTRLDEIKANIAAQSLEELDTSFREVRDALLDTGDLVEQLTRDLLAHAHIAPGRPASVVRDDHCLWDMFAMLESLLGRLRLELAEAELAALGIRP